MVLVQLLARCSNVRVALGCFRQMKNNINIPGSDFHLQSFFTFHFLS